MRAKKILLAILLTVFILMSYASEYYKAAADLKVRTGPGKGYAVSFSVKKGEEVEVVSKNAGWYKIIYLGDTGYVYSKYVRFSRNTSESSYGSQQSGPYFPEIILVCLLISIGLVLFTKRYGKLLKVIDQPKTGARSERDLVLTLQRSGIPEQHIFHDLYLEKSDGNFSQIDVAAIVNTGIIVFEVKDYSGWIYGRGNQPQWTQVLNYGKQKYRFYNPILQNKSHVNEFRKQLKLDDIPVYSIIVFYGDCELKEINYVPNGCFIVKAKRVLEAIKTITDENKELHYTIENENKIVQILKEAVANGEIIENQIKHKEHIKEMVGRHRVFD